MARIDPERAAELYAEHRSIHRVAAMLGATGEGVRQCLIRRGIRVQTREAAMKALNADPEFKARNAAASAARMKALNADPEFKARHAERMKALNADPEFKARNAARMKALHADPEFKARNAAAASKRMKALHADPEFKARLKAGIQRRHFGVEVPAWVPADLRDDYIDVARLSGEDAAASHVRRLKREAAL